MRDQRHRPRTNTQLLLDVLLMLLLVVQRLICKIRQNLDFHCVNKRIGLESNTEGISLRVWGWVTHTLCTWAGHTTAAAAVAPGADPGSVLWERSAAGLSHGPLPRPAAPLPYIPRAPRHGITTVSPGPLATSPVMFVLSLSVFPK
ncbi:hypothetical protein J6590_027115 [Homalodisca vitripennis]|nr:hypothetical protein J6590_027115 [Homalodisca vitripennis]